MTHDLRKAIALGAVALCLGTASGCFGRFRLVNGVYDFNREVNHKLARSLVMIGLIIIPVYFFAALGDILIFNVIEFYDGGVVVAQTQKLEDGSTVKVERVDADTLRIRRVDAAGNVGSVEIVKVGDKAGYVRASDGRILGMVEQLPDGRVVQTAP
jgi:hypothetical protein